MDSTLLESELTRRLGVPLFLAGARRPCPPGRLSPLEREELRGLQGAQRRATWLRGRRAWKRLLERLGQDADTARLRLPSARFSLTHGAGLALAAGVPAGSAAGLGLDLERERQPHALPRAQRARREAMARFFLDDDEREALASVPASRRAALLLQLWTVKEAVYKADPGNRGRILLDYHLVAPLAAVGVARALDRALAFRYASLPVPGGFLSVAIVPVPAASHAHSHRPERALAAQLL